MIIVRPSSTGRTIHGGPKPELDVYGIGRPIDSQKERMNGLLVWKIIIYSFVGVVGFCIAVTIFMAAVKLFVIVFTPVALVAFLAISIATYPFTLLARISGYKCRSFFQVGLDGFRNWHNPGAAPDTEYRRANTNFNRSYQTDHNRAERPSTPDPKLKNTFDPWDILGVERGTSAEALTAAYRQKMSTNHPDKVASLDPALQRFANERTVLIKKAYDQLKKVS